MFSGHTFQCLHDNLIMIYRNISRRINGCQFVLCRCHFIVLRLGRYTKFPQFFIDILHICGNFLTNRSKIMIIQFLTFRRHCTKQGSSCINQVLSLHKFLRIYKKIFLLYPNRRSYFFGSCISKKTNQTKCFFIDCLHRTKQWSLLIQCLSRIGTKCRWNTQSCTGSILTDKCRRCTIPRCISSCLKSCTQTSGRK